jgi:O-antigen/teichoic acid export membrane protein
MSTASRLVSGSIAGWVRLALAFVIQLCVIPFYLRFWDAKTYGVWISLQSAISLAQFLDNGHARFLSNELLRLGIGRHRLIRRVLWSGLAMGVVLGAIQFITVTILVLVGTNYIPQVLAVDGQLLNQAGVILVASSLTWWIFGSLGGIAIVAVAPFGHYPKMAWWSVVSLLVSVFVPVLSVVLGATLLQAGLLLVLANAATNVILYLHLACLFKASRLFPVRISKKIAFRNLIRSQFLSVQGLFDIFRLHGIRLALAPLTGMPDVAAFTTMRTGANVVLQGLHTVTNPVLPELMRFVALREQEKTEATLASIWLVIVGLMVPFACILQVIVEPAFSLWTHGQIAFDPLLFALFTVTVFIYALAQPASAIVYGNNLLRPQLTISASAALIVATIMFVLVPKIGLRGAGIALVAAELVSALAHVFVARSWMNSHHMQWPAKIFYRVVASVAAGITGVVLIATLTPYQYPILCSFLVIALILAVRVWLALPAIARERFKALKFVRCLPLSRRCLNDTA